jgi:hypothetical protein
LEGAENYDFFRQPLCSEDLLLSGSYAVYKKETLVGEGTGKLCHIHRPEIIDARGRRCWGDLAVVGNCLCITIPEKWLGEAKYPVVVDPTIGTTTIGSQQSASSGPTLNANLTYGTGVNKYIVPETLSGECTAFFYCFYKVSYGYNYTPVLFEDSNGKPNKRCSKNEGKILTQTKAGEDQWRSTQFQIIDSLQEGSNVWYGGFSDVVVATRFDYGGLFYKTASALTPHFPNDGKEQLYDFLVSWYFDYTVAKNYVRTLTQGVSITDSYKLIGNYKRFIEQEVKANSIINAFPTLTRLITETVQVVGSISRGLIYLIRIVTVLFVRDYLLGRFLKARQDLILKSCITKELSLDSRLR